MNSNRERQLPGPAGENYCQDSKTHAKCIDTQGFSDHMPVILIEFVLLCNMNVFKSFILRVIRSLGRFLSSCCVREKVICNTISVEVGE